MSDLSQRQFWDYAKSTNMPDFKVNLTEFKKLSSKEFEDILHTHPKHWCKAYFTTQVRIVDINLIETFNSMIIEVRTIKMVSIFEDVKKINDEEVAY